MGLGQCRAVDLEGAPRADAMPAGILIFSWSRIAGLGALTRGFAPGYSRIAPSEAAEKN